MLGVDLSPVDAIIYALVVSAISFLVVLGTMPRWIKYLAIKGRTVQDYHKPSRPLVPRPAGPILMLAIGAAEIVLFLLTMN
ncbi:MAG TPA: UDP-N-acetylglucosamine-1-phosphate transferase, partial [Nitrososphaera sp.]|nr:UDP-N-acetylglucosamine-1-phosphate transferase [Nitrososphaera sp.]